MISLQSREAVQILDLPTGNQGQAGEFLGSGAGPFYVCLTEERSSPEKLD